jgi:hypothetical protein
MVLIQRQADPGSVGFIVYLEGFIHPDGANMCEIVAVIRHVVKRVRIASFASKEWRVRSWLLRSILAHAHPHLGYVRGPVEPLTAEAVFP